MNLAVSCIAWVESLLKKEIEKLWYKISHTIDRMVFFDWDEASIARINLWSRVGNKVYLELAKFEAKTFDNLFDWLFDISWKKYLWEWMPIYIDAVSIKSQLNSIPSIQKIWKKAIITEITWSNNAYYNENKDIFPLEVFLFIKDDECRVLLNTSWFALHKRWYRDSSHQAPIKESLAASLVLLSWWKFREPFYDFFCWSWTILIEAWLIARNIAPGLMGRNFAFEKWDWYDKKYLKDAKIEALSKRFMDKKFEIIWSDIDVSSINLALENIKRAWLEDIISIKNMNFLDYKDTSISWTLVSNPPYWVRLNDDKIDLIYKSLVDILNKNNDLNWGFITSFEEVDKILKIKNWSKRKLYNWSIKCYFYKKNIF